MEERCIHGMLEGTCAICDPLLHTFTRQTEGTERRGRRERQPIDVPFDKDYATLLGFLSMTGSIRVSCPNHKFDFFKSKYEEYSCNWDEDDLVLNPYIYKYDSPNTYGYETYVEISMSEHIIKRYFENSLDCILSFTDTEYERKGDTVLIRDNGWFLTLLKYGYKLGVQLTQNINDVYENIPEDFKCFFIEGTEIPIKEERRINGALNSVFNREIEVFEDLITEEEIMIEEEDDMSSEDRIHSAEEDVFETGYDKVKCLECGKFFKSITHKHLSLHNMSTEEYRDKYPDASFLSQSSDDHLIEARKKGHKAIKEKAKKAKREKINAPNIDHYNFLILNGYTPKDAWIHINS